MKNDHNKKLQKEVEEADSEMVVRKKKSHLMEDLKVIVITPTNILKKYLKNEIFLLFISHLDIPGVLCYGAAAAHCRWNNRG